MARHELKQGLSIRAERAKGGHHEGNQAETETRRGRRGGGSAEVVDGRSAGDGSVGGEAGGGEVYPTEMSHQGTTGAQGRHARRAPTSQSLHRRASVRR